MSRIVVEEDVEVSKFSSLGDLYKFITGISKWSLVLRDTINLHLTLWVSISGLL